MKDTALLFCNFCWLRVLRILYEHYLCLIIPLIIFIFLMHKKNKQTNKKNLRPSMKPCPEVTYKHSISDSVDKNLDMQRMFWCKSRQPNLILYYSERFWFTESYLKKGHFRFSVLKIRFWVQGLTPILLL